MYAMSPAIEAAEQPVVLAEGKHARYGSRR